MNPLFQWILWTISALTALFFFFLNIQTLIKYRGSIRSNVGLDICFQITFLTFWIMTIGFLISFGKVEGFFINQRIDSAGVFFLAALIYSFSFAMVRSYPKRFPVAKPSSSAAP